MKTKIIPIFSVIIMLLAVTFSVVGAQSIVKADNIKANTDIELKTDDDSTDVDAKVSVRANATSSTVR
jgi:hypothetical protein